MLIIDLSVRGECRESVEDLRRKFPSLWIFGRGGPAYLRANQSKLVDFLVHLLSMTHDRPY